MVFDWFANLVGKERKAQVRDEDLPAEQKLTKLYEMVRDPDARFSVSKTLDTLAQLELQLSAEEKNGEAGATLLYIQGHVSALAENWPEAMTSWDALKDHPFGTEKFGEKFLFMHSWARTMSAYQSRKWAEALEGLDARLEREHAAGTTGIADLWQLQMKRGWCLLHLERLDEASALMQSHLNPGLTEDEVLYFYPTEQSEPLRILAQVQRAAGDINGAFATQLKELDFYKTQDPDQFEHLVQTMLEEAAEAQNWAEAEACFERFSAYYEATPYQTTKDRLKEPLEAWRQKRSAWPKAE